MAVVGLKMVTLALVNYNSGVRKVITGTEGLSEDGILQIDDTFLGSKTANITGISNSYEKEHGYDGKLFLGMSDGPQPEVSLEINNLSFGILNKLVGRYPDGNGGFEPVFDPFKVAMLIEFPTLDRKNSVYFGFGQGYLTQPSQNGGSDTGSPNRVPDNFTYIAESVQDFKEFMPYKTFYSGDPNFDEAKMMSDVFPT
jgi:hypothetical protein